MVWAAVFVIFASPRTNGSPCLCFASERLDARLLRRTPFALFGANLHTEVPCGGLFESKTLLFCRAVWIVLFAFCGVARFDTDVVLTKKPCRTVLKGLQRRGRCQQAKLSFFLCSFGDTQAPFERAPVGDTCLVSATTKAFLFLLWGAGVVTLAFLAL